MADTVAILFSDLDGSSRLWEQHPEAMTEALALHDAIAHAAVEGNGGVVVKTMGDGLFAAFEDAVDGMRAAIAFQRALAEQATTGAIALRARIGLHAGPVERRGADLFGDAVNRAARIMGAAHGGQVVLSQAVADALSGRLPGDVSLRELGTVRLRDLMRPERLWQVLHPGLRSDFPALRSLEAVPNNLPLQATSFVGREREQAEVAALLGRSRLVTLFGAGGLGKTRLSLQVGAELLERYPDGAWFVELAPLNDPRLVPQAVAGALGLREEPGRPVMEALVRFVADRTLLVILDNCEHLIAACAALAQSLLATGCRLSILASSREPLRIAGEQVYPVSTLPIPGEDDGLDAAQLQRCDAVRLFVDRASAVQPAFRLDERSAGAVAEICRRLDGIPLALELAAARLRTLPVDDVAARLDDRFRLLTGGSRTAQPRQQTLRALIDWSHDLLGANERTLFRRLAVFAGGFTLAAPESVGAGSDLDRGDVLDALASLVEKSLVAFDAEAPRYRLLETVRQYAQERLEASGERRATRKRHVAYYLDFCERAHHHLGGGPQSREWLAAMDAERENVLSAHEACGADGGDGGDGEAGLRLAYASYPYWLRRGLIETGLRVIGEALARPGANARTQARCNALHAAGLLSCFAGLYDVAPDYLEESQSIAEEVGLASGTPGRLQLLAFALLGRGDWEAARERCEQALVLARQSDNRLQVASALCNLGQTYRSAGELDKAEALFRESSALADKLANRELVAMNLLSLAMVSISRGSPREAAESAHDAAAIAEDLGLHTAGQTALDVAAGLAASIDVPDEAARFLGASQAHLSSSGLRRDPVDDAFLIPLMDRARTAIGEAAFAAAEREGRSARYEEVLSRARAWLGQRAGQRSASQGG
ncbi:MAG TPA: adenylate/guanylate cyclase domain-containing protein [Casimicrobiaceae bacterium]|nr:adenylate/guanylate cyclase domain-containing protein [Casimicrobiaceae bacterium]